MNRSGRGRLIEASATGSLCMAEPECVGTSDADADSRWFDPGENACKRAGSRGPSTGRRGTTVHSLSKVAPRIRRTSGRSYAERPLVERVPREAADGTRTHDLLHGKQWLNRGSLLSMRGPRRGDTRRLPAITVDLGNQWVMESRRSGAERERVQRSVKCGEARACCAYGQTPLRRPRRRGDQRRRRLPLAQGEQAPHACFWRDAGLVTRWARPPALSAGRNSRLVATGLLGDCAPCVLVLALRW